MAPNVDVQLTIPQLFTELQKYVAKQDPKAIIKYSNMILHTKGGQNDIDALKCKSVALIELEKFADCIKALQEVEADFVFEKAYCYYRLHDNEKSLELVRNRMDERCLELKAQLLFRMEEWEEAYNIYQSLLRNCIDSFEQERIVNMVACAAMITQFQNDIPEDLVVEVEGQLPEAAFNSACYHSGLRSYQKAEAELRRAEKLCRQTYDDQEDELASELSQIRLQSSYINQIVGKRNEAVTGYNLVIDTSTEPLTTALASHNLATMDQDTKILDSRRKMKALQATNVDSKLTKNQRLKTKRNRALLSLYSGKPAECRKILGDNKEDNDDCIINASILFQEKNYEMASSELIKYGKQNEMTELSLIKAAEMFIGANQFENAAKMLYILPNEVRFNPTVTDLLISIYTNLNNADKINQIMDESISFQKKNSSGDEGLIKMLRLSAKYKLDSGNPQLAAKILEEIHKTRPNDVAVLAELIGAYSSFDEAKAAAASRKLPSLEDLTAGLNVEEVEQWAKTIAYKKTAFKKLDEQKEDESRKIANEAPEKKLKQKAKKKRKPRYPKNYVHGKDNGPIDPERWLPLRERSYYKGRRRDKKSKIGKGNQGTAGQEKITNALDMSKKPSSPQATHAVTDSPTTGPRQERPQGKAKVSRKKGKSKGKNKW